MASVSANEESGPEGEGAKREPQKAASGVVSALQQLLGAAAVLSATLYVLVNALYIDFYDDFGVRPEQVGLDRVAVLARAAWVALIAIVLIVPTAYVVTRRALQKREAEDIDIQRPIIERMHSAEDRKSAVIASELFRWFDEEQARWEAIGEPVTPSQRERIDRVIRKAAPAAPLQAQEGKEELIAWFQNELTLRGLGSPEVRLLTEIRNALRGGVPITDPEEQAMSEPKDEYAAALHEPQEEIDKAKQDLHQARRDSRRFGFLRGLIFWGAVALIVLLLIGYKFAADHVSAEANRVAKGHSSTGLGLVVPFIDVRANRAEVTWVGDKDAAPKGLVNALFLTYLGNGEGSTVLLECGQKTYIVKSDDVVVTLLDQGRAYIEGDSRRDAAEEAAFKRACP
ncbi:hypothetical protein ACWEOW_06875 [Monashia sp. NPDC004114]